MCLSACVYGLLFARTQNSDTLSPTSSLKGQQAPWGVCVSACVCLPACLSVCLHVFGDFRLNSELRHPLTPLITERSAGPLGVCVSACVCLPVCLSVCMHLQTFACLDKKLRQLTSEKHLCLLVVQQQCLAQPTLPSKAMLDDCILIVCRLKLYTSFFVCLSTCPQACLCVCLSCCLSACPASFWQESQRCCMTCCGCMQLTCRVV